MSTTTTDLITSVDDITSSWLAGVLDLTEVEIVDVVAIGTGQMSQNHRITYTTAGTPGSVVIKLASDDESSRATGVGMKAYHREIELYRHLAPRLGEGVPTCHLAVYDETTGYFTLLLEDKVDATQGDQIAGCSPEQAELALRTLARLQAPLLNDLHVGNSDYLNLPNPIDQSLMAMLLPGFLERYADRVTPEHAEVCRTFVAASDAWLADRRPPLGLVHGDFRLDNLLLTSTACTVVDWQTVSWGPAMLDASYFLGGSLTVDDRRRHEERLLRAYHDELVASGVQNFTWETCWEEYRRQTFLSLLMVIVAAMVVERTDRGDEMFLTVLDRACAQVLDLDSLSLLPPPGARPTALVPDPADEGLHLPGPEPLWNESWYFDAVSDDGSTGVYVRLGRLPNQDVCVYTAAIVRPGLPPLMVVDYLAPLPAADDPTAQVTTDAFTGTMRCEQQLQRFHLTLSGIAEAYDDPTGVFRGESGSPTPVGLDLCWETDGTPYAWRSSTRYEIPCRVMGTVEIDGHVLELSGPGQRDHSWGSRDWWANDWMWSAFHLEDGTRTHVVTTPDLPGYAVGYHQRDGVVVEVESGSSSHQPGGDGLVTSARIDTEPDASSVQVVPLAFGPLMLTAPDGRQARFQRAMARVTTADGRSGLGWIEWNTVNR